MLIYAAWTIQEILKQICLSNQLACIVSPRGNFHAADDRDRVNFELFELFFVFHDET
jgi:hypothetical protein